MLLSCAEHIVGVRKEAVGAVVTEVEDAQVWPWIETVDAYSLCVCVYIYIYIFTYVGEWGG